MASPCPVGRINKGTARMQFQRHCSHYCLGGERTPASSEDSGNARTHCTESPQVHWTVEPAGLARRVEPAPLCVSELTAAAPLPT